MRTTTLLRSEDVERAVDERLNELIQGATVLGSAAPIAIKAFTGREWDPETGLYYYRARYYDPKAGRFISEDPIGFEGGVNFLSYVGNNPTKWRDPSGHEVFPNGVPQMDLNAKGALPVLLAPVVAVGLAVLPFEFVPAATTAAGAILTRFRDAVTQPGQTLTLCLTDAERARQAILRYLEISRQTMEQMGGSAGSKENILKHAASVEQEWRRSPKRSGEFCRTTGTPIDQRIPT